MRAALARRYGGPEVVEIVEVPRPEPDDGQILVRVAAAAVNPLDWHLMRGEPMIMRLSGGLQAPEDPRMGRDFAGVIESVGAGITEFRVGQEVFGATRGAFAEYALVDEESLVLKPSAISFEDAAAMPVAALTALQALRMGNAGPGKHVLVNGASGGVGTFAIQLAKWMGARVSGTCSRRNRDLVRGLGTDVVLDYENQDYTRETDTYDLIVDCAGSRRLRDSRRAMRRDGRLIIIGGPKGRWLNPVLRMVRGMILSATGNQQFLPIMTKTSQPDLEVLRELAEGGKLRSVIDRRYPLAEARAAIDYVEQGHARGKVVISFA